MRYNVVKVMHWVIRDSEDNNYTVAAIAESLPDSERLIRDLCALLNEHKPGSSDTL